MRFSCIFLLAICAACGGRQAAPDPNLLASYRQGTVTLEDLDRFILELPPQRRMAPSEKEPIEWLRRELEKTFQQKVLVSDEDMLFLETDHQFQTRLRMENRRDLSSAYLRVHMAPTNVDEDEIRAYVESHIPELTMSEKRLVHNFLVSFPLGATPAQKAEVRQRAADYLTQIRNGASFETIAQKFSDSATAKNGGLIGAISRKDLRPRMAEIIFSLKGGQLSEVIESKAGCQFFYVREVLREVLPNYQELRHRVYQGLLNQKRSQWIVDQFAHLCDERGIEAPIWRQTEIGAADGEEVVFRYGEDFLTRSEVIAQTAPGSGSEETLARLAGILLMAEVFREERPEFAANMTARNRRTMAFQQFRTKALRQAAENLPGEELSAFYEKNRARFQKDPEVELTLFEWPIQGDPLEALSTPNRLAMDLKGGQAIDESGYPGMSKRIVPLTSMRALAHRETQLVGMLPWSPAEGTILGPFRIGQTIIVIRVDSFLPSRPLSFSEAREQVAAEYASRNAAFLERTWVERLKDNHEYRIYPENLNNYGRNLLQGLLDGRLAP